MKRLICFILKAFLVYAYASDIQSTLEHELKIKFYSSANDTYLPKCIEAKYDKMVIRMFNKKYENSIVDFDDWYSSRSIRKMYDEILTNGSFSYGFGLDNRIIKKVNSFISDYLVLSMYEVEDFRFERFILVFKETEAYVVQITNSEPFLIYQKELEKCDYIIHRDGNPDNSLIWDYRKNAIEVVVKNLRSNFLNARKFQELYNLTQDIYKIIESCV